MSSPFTCLLVEITFSISTLLHDWHATATFKIRFSPPKTLFTVGMRKKGWQTLAATGNTVKHDIINQNCTGEQCITQGRKDKKKEGKMALRAR